MERPAEDFLPVFVVVVILGCTNPSLVLSEADIAGIRLFFLQIFSKIFWRIIKIVYLCNPVWQPLFSRFDDAAIFINLKWTQLS